MYEKTCRYADFECVDFGACTPADVPDVPDDTDSGVSDTAGDSETNPPAPTAEDGFSLTYKDVRLTPGVHMDVESVLGAPVDKTEAPSCLHDGNDTVYFYEDLEVVTPGTTTPVRRLSGGNVQKVLVGREIAASPTVLMAAYPVRGLDINSSYTIYNLLNQQKEKGVAVIFVGEDLDVLLELCDRILVIGGGKVTGVLDGRTATKEQVGLLMTKTEGGEQA